jgi:hypothetical protein
VTRSSPNRTENAEAWLESNHRALVMATIPAGLMAFASLAALLWAWFSGQHWSLVLLFSLLFVAPSWAFAQLVYALRMPRIGYSAGHLLLHFDPARPIRVPIEIVECFFLGQGPSDLPKLAGREPETQNVIVRLAESATEWKHRDVKPAFGHWCEGYITIRGAWCEPITPELMKNLNARLAEVHRERKATAEQGAAK